MDFLTPELMDVMVAERRRMASAIRIQRQFSPSARKWRLRRLIAGALAFVAARIHFESAHLALHSAAER